MASLLVGSQFCHHLCDGGNYLFRINSVGLTRGDGMLRRKIIGQFDN
jgi:hypothetical protein